MIKPTVTAKQRLIDVGSNLEGGNYGTAICALVEYYNARLNGEIEPYVDSNRGDILAANLAADIANSVDDELEVRASS
jgi:hypothetical protein